MKAGLSDYVKAAFGARPIGMLVPPNWIGLGIFAILGVINPGFWVLGAGLELGYLYVLVHNPRFQRYVDGTQALAQQSDWKARQQSLVSRLSREEQMRYGGMERLCRSILEQQRTAESNAGLKTESDGLARMLWVFLRLLLTRQAIIKVLNETSGGTDDTLEQRVMELTATSKKPDLNEDLRKSITGQLEIVQQRLAKRKEARDKIAFLDSELSRIEEQAELIREQTVLTTDPEVVSQRVDQIAATLGGTSQWIREQQKLYGQVEDLMTEPPPATFDAPMKEGN